jgi:hypothetical protein
LKGWNEEEKVEEEMKSYRSENKLKIRKEMRRR